MLVPSCEGPEKRSQEAFVGSGFGEAWVLGGAAWARLGQRGSGRGALQLHTGEMLRSALLL